jgi:hypothetical protein
MKLSIIPSDGTVVKDNYAYTELDLTSANIPSDVHALQWKETQGHIEFVDNVQPPEEITELPTWANTCVLVWESAKAAEDARKAKEAAALEAKLAAEQAAN